MIKDFSSMQYRKKQLKPPPLVIFKCTTTNQSFKKTWGDINKLRHPLVNKGLKISAVRFF
jgi:hypothetical protein